jgi:ribosomal-protein-serine acetyltransferase
MSAMFRIPIRPDLELRLCVQSHADAVFALVDENRDHLGPWMPWVNQTWSSDDTAQWITHGLEQLQRNQGWHALLWYRDELAGAIGFKPVNWSDMRVEIGYWLGRRFQGKGLMTDAARAVTDHAFREWALNRVEIRCAVKNDRSIAIPRRLGFAQEGMLRQAFRVGDEYQDLLLFGMLRSDWT